MDGNTAMKLWLLGLPIDALNEDEVVKKALDVIDNYQEEETPQYFATVNLDFIANSWGFSGINNKEFLTTLREARLSTADGFPLVFLSKILSSPLPMRVTGQDLFPKLVHAITNAKKSLFLLGGSPEALDQCQQKLELEFPEVIIAGTLSPTINSSREALERDRIILEAIHQNNPDLLFLQLGAPKQELWFHRVKKELKVPLSIGVGGTFERYVGHISRSPGWMQKCGFEWIWRLLQEPRRLFGRYIHDGIKFIWLGVPLVTYYKCSQFVAFRGHINQCDDLCFHYPLLFLSPQKTIFIVRLPCLVDKERVPLLTEECLQGLEHDLLLIDFKKLQYLDLFGFYQLFEVWKEAKKRGKMVLGINLSKRYQKLFSLNKLWDYVAENFVHNVDEILNRLQSYGTLFFAIEQEHAHVRLYFFGSLSAEHPYEEILEKLLSIIELKPLTIDLSYCSGYESRGEWFLTKLKEHQQAVREPFLIENNTPHILI